MTNPALHQWFTPAWAAEALVEQEFGWLGANHAVCEPACGDGAFLCAIPQHVRAIGVEIDPIQAGRARLNSGREVLDGDFLTVDLPRAGFDAVIGNPPFDASLIARFLQRTHGLLRDGGEAGFILPAYIFQTSSKVEKYARLFSIKQSLLPRNLFPGLRLPLVFAKFIKDNGRTLFGFLLYREAQEVASLARRWRERLARARGPAGAWFSVVDAALAELGGEADLQAIYACVAGRQPTDNENWKQQVRKILQNGKRFTRTSAARYRRIAEAPEACRVNFVLEAA